MAIILSNLNRFAKFFTGRFFCKLAIKCFLKISPHLAYVATLPCETFMSKKQAINDKSPGSAATYLRCVWVVNNQIKKGLLLILLVEEFLKSVKVMSKNVFISCTFFFL